MTACVREWVWWVCGCVDVWMCGGMGNGEWVKVVGSG